MSSSTYKMGHSPSCCSCACVCNRLPHCFLLCERARAHTGRESENHICILYGDDMESLSARANCHLLRRAEFIRQSSHNLRLGGSNDMARVFLPPVAGDRLRKGAKTVHSGLSKPFTRDTFHANQASILAQLQGGRNKLAQESRLIETEVYFCFSTGRVKSVAECLSGFCSSLYGMDSRRSYPRRQKRITPEPGVRDAYHNMGNRPKFHPRV